MGIHHYRMILYTKCAEAVCKQRVDVYTPISSFREVRSPKKR